MGTRTGPNPAWGCTSYPPRAKIHMNCFPCLVSNIYDIKPASINSGTKVPMAGQGEGHDDWLSSKERNKMDVHNVIIAVILMNWNYFVIITLLYQHRLLCNIFIKIFIHTLTLVIGWKALRRYTFWLYTELKNRTWCIIICFPYLLVNQFYILCRTITHKSNIIISK